jgi:hypothetical protein
VENAHGNASEVAWLSGRTAEFSREAETTVRELARYGNESFALANWACAIANNYAGIGDVPNAISYGQRCLTLPSGTTVWNLKLSPDWQGILTDPKVQALFREFSTR